VKLESETKDVDLEMNEAERDEKFATYAQKCTDGQDSVNQISGNASGTSRKSTASSNARRLERIKTERLKAEMEARLQSEKRKIELVMEMSIKNGRSCPEGSFSGNGRNRIPSGKKMLV